MILCCGKSLPNCSARIKYLGMIMLGALNATITTAVYVYGPDQSSEANEQNLSINICFYMALFFFAMGFATLMMSKFQKQRAALHNGFWVTKCCILIGAIVGLTYIPKEYQESYSNTIFHVDLLGGSIFIVSQLFLLFTFLLDYVKPWIHLRNQNVSARYGCLFILLFLLCCAPAGCLLAYIEHNYFWNSDIDLSRTWPTLLSFLHAVAIIIVVCLFVSLILGECIRCSHLVFLIASFLCLYAVLFTWSATLNAFGWGPDDVVVPLYFQLVLQLGIWLFSMIYQSIGCRVVPIQPRPIIGPKNQAVAVIDLELNEDGDNSGERADGEYCWPAFHFMMSLGCLYFSMTIIDFSTLASVNQPAELKNYRNNAVLLVKLVSTLLCYLLSGVFSYIWGYYFDPSTAYHL